MPKSDSNAFRFMLGISIHACLMLALAPVSAQEVVGSAPATTTAADGSNPVVRASSSTSVTALKPNFSKRESKEAAAKSNGFTEVLIDKRLDFVSHGGDPKPEDLLALQEQQIKLASKIQSVTVHIEQGTAQGSGVIITPDGYILTAAHVAGKPNRDAWIRLPDGRRVRGRTMGMNRNVDAGLVKIDDSVAPTGNAWPHATLGTSSPLRPGHWVMATGHPGGYSKDRPNAVVRVGRITETMASTLVTDCALIGGDSGGPLFDLQGKLVGIHSRIGTNVNDNMHVPIDVFSDSWDRLARSEAWGTLPGYKPVIGVEGSKTDTRPIISTVYERSPAERAGIRVGDLIRKFDGVALNSFQDLKQAVSSSLPGDRVKIEVERNGKTLDLFIEIGQEG